MKMTHDTDVLKAENGEDLLPLFRELTERGCRAARAGEPVHAVEKSGGTED
jgi:hypothetical protein